MEEGGNRIQVEPGWVFSFYVALEHLPLSTHSRTAGQQSHRQPARRTVRLVPELTREVPGLQQGSLVGGTDQLPMTLRGRRLVQLEGAINMGPRNRERGFGFDMPICVYRMSRAMQQMEAERLLSVERSR